MAATPHRPEAWSSTTGSHGFSAGFRLAPFPSQLVAGACDSWMEPGTDGDTGARAGESSEVARMESGGPSVEKRGPYLMSKGPTIQAKLQRHRDLAREKLRKKGMLGASGKLKSAPKRSVKFNKGYAALSQALDETLVSLDSDSDAELESRCSSGYSSAEQVSQDLNRQLLQDGYRLDEIPDDEDLDLIPPKPVRSVSCPCCPGEFWSCSIQ
ncbi:protein FAM219B [Ascaphus truei]|uniref:protein FAM219B n=1 Tax=Ascaphus truei TaxID=8439 RepID=UPI003F5A551B